MVAFIEVKEFTLKSKQCSSSQSEVHPISAMEALLVGEMELKLEVETIRRLTLVG